MGTVILICLLNNPPIIAYSSRFALYTFLLLFWFLVFVYGLGGLIYDNLGIGALGNW